MVWRRAVCAWCSALHRSIRRLNAAECSPSAVCLRPVCMQPAAAARDQPGQPGPLRSPWLTGLNSPAVDLVQAHHLGGTRAARPRGCLPDSGDACCGVGRRVGAAAVPLPAARQWRGGGGGWCDGAGRRRCRRQRRRGRGRRRGGAGRAASRAAADPRRHHPRWASRLQACRACTLAAAWVRPALSRLRVGTCDRRPLTGMCSKHSTHSAHAPGPRLALQLPPGGPRAPSPQEHTHTQTHTHTHTSRHHGPTPAVEALFQAFCEGAERNPDDLSDDDDAGGGGFFYDEDAALAGIASAALGVGDVDEVRSAGGGQPVGVGCETLPPEGSARLAPRHGWDGWCRQLSQPGQ